MHNTEEANLRFMIAFCETNLRYLHGEQESEARTASIAHNEIRIKEVKEKLGKLGKEKGGAMLTRKLRLTIDVAYQEAEACQQALRDLLHQAAEHLRDEGMLSGTTPAWVLEATHKVEEIGGWKTVPEKDVRLVYRCKDCLTEYHIAPGEASIPYCTEDDCANAECDTDFERVEVRT